MQIRWVFRQHRQNENDVRGGRSSPSTIFHGYPCNQVDYMHPLWYTSRWLIFLVTDFLIQSRAAFPCCNRCNARHENKCAFWLHIWFIIRCFISFLCSLLTSRKIKIWPPFFNDVLEFLYYGQISKQHKLPSRNLSSDRIRLLQTHAWCIPLSQRVWHSPLLSPSLEA